MSHEGPEVPSTRPWLGLASGPREEGCLLAKRGHREAVARALLKIRGPRVTAEAAQDAGDGHSDQEQHRHHPNHCRFHGHRPTEQAWGVWEPQPPIEARVGEPGPCEAAKRPPALPALGCRAPPRGPAAGITVHLFLLTPGQACTSRGQFHWQLLEAQSWKMRAETPRTWRAGDAAQSEPGQPGQPGQPGANGGALGSARAGLGCTWGCGLRAMPLLPGCRRCGPA